MPFSDFSLIFFLITSAKEKVIDLNGRAPGRHVNSAAGVGLRWASSPHPLPPSFPFSLPPSPSLSLHSSLPMLSPKGHVSHSESGFVR